MVTLAASMLSGVLLPVRAKIHSSAAGLSCDLPLGQPVLPVMKTCPLRRATNAPVGTVTHQTMPS